MNRMCYQVINQPIVAKEKEANSNNTTLTQCPDFGLKVCIESLGFVADTRSRSGYPATTGRAQLYS